MGSHTSLTRCHSTLMDLHVISLFLPVWTFLKYFTAPESCARLFSPKYSSIFIPLIHNAWSSTLSLCCSTGCSQDIFLTTFLSSDSNISLPLPLPLQITQRSTALLILTFFSSILLSGFLFFPSYHLQIASFLSSAMLEILSWKRDLSFFFF